MEVGVDAVRGDQPATPGPPEVCEPGVLAEDRLLVVDQEPS